MLPREGLAEGDALVAAAAVESLCVLEACVVDATLVELMGDDEPEDAVIASGVKGKNGMPRQDAIVPSLGSCDCSIKSWKHSSCLSHSSPSAGCGIVVPLGMTVLSVVVVASDPEHVAIVEHSVVKPLVIAPDTMFVTLQLETVVVEQLSVVDVVSVAPVCEHASTVLHEVVKLVEFPETIAVASHVGTAVLKQSLEEVDVGFPVVTGSSGSAGFGGGGGM